ncbi:acetate kinase [Nakamurella sp. UYEF19]|uniref:hypothetical protein n=1 Tax=Nakamurella sp. UYEF19 TaxID=1756392 RepID=UPI0033986F49
MKSPPPLEQRSGILALAGTADMRQVDAAAQRREPDAQLAMDIYIHHLAAGIAAMSAATAGLDVLVFTGGIGEQSSIVRERAARRLGYLGVEIDHRKNKLEGDDVISPPDASVQSLVITAREDLQIAAEVRQLLTAK